MFIHKNVMQKSARDGERFYLNQGILLTNITGYQTSPLWSLPSQPCLINYLDNLGILKLIMVESVHSLLLSLGVSHGMMDGWLVWPPNTI